MIVGMIKPENGSIFLDGEDIGQLPMYQKARRGIGYLPQEPSIFRKLTVRDNLRAVLEIKGYPDADIAGMVEDLLDEFNLRVCRQEWLQAFRRGTKKDRDCKGACAETYVYTF